MKGVRQGCQPSSYLFNMLFEEAISTMKNRVGVGYNGIQDHFADNVSLKIMRKV